MKLINEKFVPYAPRWGHTGYQKEYDWILSSTGGRPRNADLCRIAGTMWCILTASGSPVKSDGRRMTLAMALDTYSKLPVSERRPAIEPREPFNPKAEPMVDWPYTPGDTVIHVYCRVLEEAQGKFQHARKVAFNEFGQTGSADAPGRFEEPQRDALWLKPEEVEALIPSSPSKGQKLKVSEAVSKRIHLFYLFNWFNFSGGGSWTPKALQSWDLTLTVQEASSKIIRMSLEGSPSLRRELSGEAGVLSLRESGQKGIPDPWVVSYDARLQGVVEVDVANKELTRFDAVALGDYRGYWGGALKANPVPIGISLELDRRKLPPECRHAPYSLSRWGPARYWAPDKWLEVTK